jgi:hypothetical protein
MYNCYLNYFRFQYSLLVKIVRELMQRRTLLHFIIFFFYYYYLFQQRPQYELF